MNIKFRGFIPAVTHYVKSKPVVEVIMEVFAYGFLAPLAIGGISFFIFMMITGQVNYQPISPLLY